MIQPITQRSAALTKFMAEKKNAPFEWGVNDCCMFACDWIERAAGIDPASGFRGRYDSRKQAQAILFPFGGTVRGIAKAICRSQEFPVIDPPSMAQRGDLVLFDGEAGDTLGVVDDSGITIAGPGLHGIQRAGIEMARAAWKVG